MILSKWQKCGLGYDERESHASVIRDNYVFLLENLDAKRSSLVDHLISFKVISLDETEDIKAQTTTSKANDKLLSVLSRKSHQQFQLFLDALDKCELQYICSKIVGRFVNIYAITSVTAYCCKQFCIEHIEV